MTLQQGKLTNEEIARLIVNNVADDYLEIKIQEALDAKDLDLTKLEKVREALKLVKADSQEGDGWVSIAVIMKCAEALHLLDEIMGKK